MQRWQVQEAKARLSELMEKAVKEGPQVITKHGADHVVVISVLDYGLIHRKRRNVLEVLRDGPDLEDWLPPREIDPEREIEWE